MRMVCVLVMCLSCSVAYAEDPGQSLQNVDQNNVQLEGYKAQKGIQYVTLKASRSKRRRGRKTRKKSLRFSMRSGRCYWLFVAAPRGVDFVLHIKHKVSRQQSYKSRLSNKNASPKERLSRSFCKSRGERYYFKVSASRGGRIAYRVFVRSNRSSRSGRSRGKKRRRRRRRRRKKVKDPCVAACKGKYKRCKRRCRTRFCKRSCEDSRARCYNECDAANQAKKQAAAPKDPEPKPSGPRSFATLRKILQNGRPGTKRSALRELVRFGPKALPLLLNALQDPHPLVSGEASNSLAALGTPALAPMRKRLSAPQAITREWAAETLGKMRAKAAPAIPALRKALSDRDGDVRTAAAKALGKIGSPARSSIPALRKLLKDPVARVRQAAQSAIVLLQKKP